MYETLSKQELNAMTSDSYKSAFEGANGDDFRKRVSELENQPRQATRPAGNVRGEQAPEPKSVGFDPSFDDAPGSAPAAAAEPAQSAQAASDTEIVREYQPTTADGKPIGGKQVFRGKTVEEVLDKVIAAHKAASARIRILSRDRKLDSIAAAGAAPRIQPEKEVPTTVEGLAAELRAQRESNFVLAVRAAVNEFQASVDWTKYRSNENAKSVILAVERASADPTDPASYHRAFVNMRDYLEPVSQPAPSVVEPAPAPVVEQPKAAAAAPALAPARRAYGIPTGLSSIDGGDDAPAAPLNATPSVGIVVNGTRITSIAQWDRLSADVQKRALRNPSQAAVINQMYDDQAAQAQAARRGGR